MDHGRFYIAMELVEKGTLDKLIELQGRVGEVQVLEVGIQIASGLRAAHEAGLIHRDVKPGNILFNADDEPKLVDFGLARSAEAEPESTTVTEGTPYYVAPEKIKRERETFLSDMYSLGCTLYHALTGHVPFEAETIEDVVASHVHTPLTPPHAVNPAITEPTSEAISVTMAKSPAERYQTYDDLIMALTASRSQLLIQTFRDQEGKDDSGGSPTGRSWWRR
jgi:serine/threonine protein kinase